ncbi:hypothetical protein PQR15_27500 [Streptomyces lydicus]|nr:hypothetical protein [Streptomyces lydicus]
MEGLDTLTRSLARRTPEQLAALLTRHAEPLARRPAPTELRGLASALWSYETLHHLVLHVDHPRLKVLATTARISQERAAQDAPGPAAPAPGADYQSLMAHRLSFAQLATAPVPPEDVLAALEATGAARDAAESALRALYDDALAAPTEDGAVVVPPRTPSSSPPTTSARSSPKPPPRPGRPRRRGDTRFGGLRDLTARRVPGRRGDPRRDRGSPAGLPGDAARGTAQVRRPGRTGDQTAGQGGRRR